MCDTLLLVQLDDEWYIAVVNKASDEVAKTLGSTHSAAQIAFLKTVVRPFCHHCFHAAASWPALMQIPRSHAASLKNVVCLRAHKQTVLPARARMPVVHSAQATSSDKWLQCRHVCLCCDQNCTMCSSKGLRWIRMHRVALPQLALWMPII